MEFLGKTVEEAVKKGLAELNLTEDQAEIIAEPTKGLFSSKKAKVEITKKLSDGERAVNFLEGLFDKLDIIAKAELLSEGEKIEINVITDSSAMVIGYRGETLDAIQSLAGAIANTGRENYKRVVVDCEDYRQKREETLISLAKKMEKKATDLGRNISLEPMSPYERRIIHSALASSETVTTTSEGKEPNRYVVVVPNEKKAFVRKDNKRGGKKFDRKSNEKGRAPQNKEPKRKPSVFGTYLGNSLKD